MNSLRKSVIKYRSQIWVLVCFGVGIFMMCNNLFHSALWGDEWCEYDFSQWPFSGTDWNFYYIVTHTYQPPLYNLIMHFWLMVSKSLKWFRLFNIIPGFISLVALYKSIMELLDKKIYAGISVLLLSCCYQWIYYVQECAEYCLMLMFLFLATMFWIRLMCKNRVMDYMLFVISIVCAIYSQYGGAIVGIPLICFAFLEGIKNWKDKRKFWIIQFSFAMGAVSGLILYRFFLSIQVARMQEVYSYSIETLNIGMFGDIFLNIGKILHWLFKMPENKYGVLYCVIIGMLFLSVAVWCLCKTWNSLKAKVVKVFLLTYLFHFLLVKSWLYARGAIEERYSLFFLPITVLTVCVIIEFLISEATKIKTCIVIASVVFVFVIFSASKILPNWNKAYDDYIAKIWYENVFNKGYSEKIYFVGYPSYPIIYYLEKYGYDYKSTTRNMTDADVNNETELENEFWIWSTGWGNNNYDLIVDKAKNEGYTVEVFCDFQTKGMLAYCNK